MRALRYLLRSFNIINVCLLGVVVLFFFLVIWPLFHVRSVYVLPQGKTKAEFKEPVPPGKTTPPSPLDYVTIGDKNLFHPERTIPALQKAEKPIPRPELVLYGTIVTDGSALAFIEDKKAARTTAGRGKRQSVIRKGDAIGGFVLKEIMEDGILLSRGEETMVVRLTEAGKQRGGDSQGSPGSPSTLPAAAASGAASAPVRSAVAPASVRSGVAPVPAPQGPPLNQQVPQVRRRALMQGNTIPGPGAQ